MMCGLVGYIGPRTAPLVVFEGLNKLEYRGYDWAGIATLQNGEIVVQRKKGKLSDIASHIPAVLEYTQRMIFLGDGEIAIVARDGASFINLAGAPVKKAIPI